MRMRTCSKTSQYVYSLKLYHSFVKASSIDSSSLSIISAIRSSRSFANGYEKHLLRTLDFLTPSEKWGINDSWEPPLVLFLFFQFLLFFPPVLSDCVVVYPLERFSHTSNSFYSDMRPVSIDGEVVASIDDHQQLNVRTQMRTFFWWDRKFNFKYCAWNHNHHRVMYHLHSFVKPSSFFCAYKWSQMFGVSIVWSLGLVHSFLNL